ncbi:4Fe-4S dicluster domain-containing protein [Candidatus Falkowbacteria bacterium]|nr:4Fe-4S dicluster domain-containing protein [Candidatus Falkowbacteria bacterium]
MNQKEMNNFAAKLLANYLVYAPIKKAKEVIIEKINLAGQIDWTGAMPINTFKRVLLPPREVMFNVEGQEYKERLTSIRETILFGVNILDLQAITLLDHVFEKDVYYQKRRQDIFTVGLTGGIENDFRKYRVFHQAYEENVLEHVMFDVFIEKQKNGNFILFSGSEKGRTLLESCNIVEYENIEFAGLVPEKGVDNKIVQNRLAVENSEKHNLWKELAQTCLACGKCSIVCPTCFCFDEQDEATLEGVEKARRWSSCFYSDFSKTAGGKKDLDALAKKLYFWYTHKFVRVPEELSYYGCVSCMRCYKVCPVGINVARNLQALSSKESRK